MRLYYLLRIARQYKANLIRNNESFFRSIENNFDYDYDSM